MKKLNQKNILSATVSMLMTSVVCQSVSVHASDIEIYSNATGGQTTITMMLDTSGSMSISQVGSDACDLGGLTSDGTGTEESGTTPSYTKQYCKVEAKEDRYYYRRVRTGFSNYTWYNCKADGTPVTNTANCNYNTSRSAPSTTGFTPTGNCTNTANAVCYWHKNEVISTEKYYDRLTRLKNAIFTLMDSDQLDSSSVAIGIGQYSSQSGSDNVFTSADGSSGKILVPAALLTPTQRTAIKTAVANLQGSNGTPTANAYAEVAAYMLGTNTTTSVTGYKDQYVGYPSGSSTRYGRCTAWRGLQCSSYTTSGYLTSSTGWVTRQGTWNNDTRTFLMSEVTDTAANLGFSGFAKSVLGSKVNSLATAINYQTPLSTSNTQCNGQGIYFLTDGEPNSAPAPTAIMQAALGTKGTSFSIPVTGTLPNGTQYGHGMPEVGEFSKALRDKTKNPLGLEIKTAVVGFGSDFNVDRTADAAKPVAERIIRRLNYINSKGEETDELRDYYNCSLITDTDAKNACNWGAKSHPDLPSSVGGYGEGGFYSAQSTDDVVDSIIRFLDDVKPEFDPIATGSPTLPQDALNPLRIQPYGYYGSFTPKPQGSSQLWAGNLNKYHVVDGQLYDANKTLRLIQESGVLNKNAEGIWVGGVTGRLPLKIGTNQAGEKVANRIIFTNRQITGTAGAYKASEADSLKRVSVDALFGTDSETAVFVNDPDKNYWLNLLGYNVGATETGITLDSLDNKPELRQMGAVMHSKPILLTQEGKIVVDANGDLDTTDRKDYLLYGSTQGLLHVVEVGKDTSTNRGKEVFAFAPHEMMKNQRDAFLSENSTTGGANNLFYGIDAPWTAYTQYVSKSDNTQTVYESGRKVKESDDGEEIELKGLQWVYGGLRMGGRSYYALDLSDIMGTAPRPELKFHINPDGAVTTDADGNPTTTPDTNNALSYMGQSWSKPTIAYVNFGGERKLVMFVGGGYDTGYENAEYNQSNGVGAGVYMFDAHNGDLLWWTGVNATANKGAEAHTLATNMKYSVVSQINTIDRDNDGLVDHLYFGDLGGQGWRVDLDNSASAPSNFAKHVVRLFNNHAAAGASPRFYEMPSISIHEDDGDIAAVAFSSGNRSSPLSGLAAASGLNNQSGSTTSAVDAVFVVYDKDVARTDLYNVATTALTTRDIDFISLNDNFATGVSIAGNSGWSYTYSSRAGVYKGMNEIFALDGMLFTNVYHRDGAGIGGSCGAGVRGDTYVYQFCLPTGKCPEGFYATGQTQPNRAIVGGGILGAGLGQAGNLMRLIVNHDEEECKKAENKNKPECQKFTTTAKIRQLRWYETR